MFVAIPKRSVFVCIKNYRLERDMFLSYEIKMRDLPKQNTQRICDQKRETDEQWKTIGILS